jgi:hypothetical protein
MHALHLSKGMGTPKNVPLARHVPKEACRFGPDDAACIQGIAGLCGVGYFPGTPSKQSFQT